MEATYPQTQQLPLVDRNNALLIRSMSPNELGSECIALIHNKGFDSGLVNVVALAFLAYRSRHIPQPNKQALLELVAQSPTRLNDTKDKLKEILDKCYEEVQSLATKWSDDNILSVILSNFSWYTKMAASKEDYSCTPAPICYLARNLLQIKQGDFVLDYCFGTAEFALDVFLHTDSTSICGNEIHKQLVIISDIRFMLLKNANNLMLNQGDSITSELKADKVFADPPFGMRNMETGKNWQPSGEISAIYNNIPTTKRKDWTFVLSALSKQMQDGRTVILAYDSLLYRKTRGENDLRRYLLESGKLEAIISLPQGILSNTNVMCNLLVFSQNNTSVKMVDARDCHIKERFSVKMTQENMDEVLRRFYSDSEYSCTVSYEQIAKQNFALNPYRYMKSAQINVVNGVELKNLVLSLERGIPLTAAKLDSLTSQVETDFSYLMLQDIDNDTIKSPLTYLTHIDESWQKYCLSQDSIIISRSAPIKIAITPTLKEKKILASGNMYFMQTDSKRIHPIYLLCYLKSDEGQRQIKLSFHGNTVPIISRADLEKIQIPLIPMNEQMKIVNKYMSICKHLDKIAKYEHLLKDQLKNILKKTDQ